MFIKRVKGGSKNRPIYYFQLARSVRTEKGPRHETLCTLGRCEDLIRSGELKRLAQGISRHLDDAVLLDLEKESIKGAKLLGSVLVVEKAFRDLELDKKLGEIARGRKIQFDLVKAVKLMVLNRLLDPSSKLSVMKWKEGLYNAEEYGDIQLQHLYRALDILKEETKVLQRHMYKRTLELFKPQVNLVLYDLTTLHFESEVADELKRFGYSKDHRNDCVQVVLGVVLSGDGMPITYELFPGDTFEGHTVVEMVERLKAEFEVQRVIFVGDRGLASAGVLRELEGMGCGYVVAARLKKLPEKIKQEITKEAGWEEITEDLRVKEIEVRGKRLVVYWSRALAAEDEAKREGVLEWIKEQLMKNPKRLIVGKRYSRYLQVEGARIKFNQGLIEKEKRLDGMFGFWCYGEDLSKEEVYRVYKLLWQVEEAFRSMKSNLRVRPLYHWTPGRILGHVAMCYIAFCVYKVLERRLTEAGIEMSVTGALGELNQVVAVEIETPKGMIKARSEIKGEKERLFRAFKTRIPRVVLEKRETNQG